MTYDFLYYFRLFFSNNEDGNKQKALKRIIMFINITFFKTYCSGVLFLNDENNRYSFWVFCGKIGSTRVSYAEAAWPKVCACYTMFILFLPQSLLQILRLVESKESMEPN